MATNYVTADYTEVIDLQTVADKTSIIGIHTPVGISPYAKLSGFFDQFRKYKYNGIKSLIMVPSAGLPIDPLGVTRMTGTTGSMDPRDTFNPIITHGAHGESLTSTLDKIYTSRAFVNADGTPGKDTTSTGIVQGQSPSTDEIRISNVIDTVYYQKLTDTSWKKWGIQSGVKMRNLYPLVHKLALNRPILPVGNPGSSALGLYATNKGEFEPLQSGSTQNAYSPDASNAMSANNAAYLTAPVGMNIAAGSDHSYLQEFTNGMTRLGWLPTATTSQANGDMNVAMLPKLMMMCMVLPPAYSCEQFFRLVIKHSFSFADFTSSLGLKTKDHPSLTNSNYHNFIDYQSSSSKSLDSLEVNEGTTIDVINGSTDLVSDGVS